MNQGSFWMSFLISLCLSQQIHAQTCPNLDAEQQDFANWQLFTGSFDEPFQNAGLDPLSHQIFSGNYQDPNIPDLQISSIGNYSFILGNNGEGSETDKMRYTFDVAADNYILSINFLPVFTQEQEPEVKSSKFSVQVFDAGIPVSECLIDTFFADLNNPFYNQYINGDSNFLYASQWQNIALSLEEYIGETVDLLFSSDECFFSNHYTYTYLDVSCHKPVIEAFGCNNQVIAQAPVGFANYDWSNGETGQQIELGSLDELTNLSVTLTGSSGSSCMTTISDFEINGNEIFDLQIEHDASAVSCERMPIQFNYQVKPITNFSSIRWDFGDGASSNELSPIHEYQFGGMYTVLLNVSTAIGCTYVFTEMVPVSGPLDPNIQWPENRLLQRFRHH